MSSYEEEYHKWVNGLSPKEQAKLKAKGLDEPLSDNPRTYKSDPTVAFEKASSDFDYDALDAPSEAIENAIGELAISYGCNLLRWTFERLQRAKSDRQKHIETDTLMLALGMEQTLGVRSQSELAQKYKMTRSAISSRVKSWQKFLNLRPTLNMKSPTACKSYRKARLANLTKC